MPRTSKAIISILGYVCIVATLLVVIFKPWEVIKATPQTRATPTALIDSNSIITSEPNLPPPELPVAEEDAAVIYKHVDHIESQPKQSDVMVGAKTEVKKKKSWFRFASPGRQR